jgi:hypothetical protein
MTGAIALYERLGYRRAPEFDVDMAAHFGGPDAAPIPAIAYLRHLTGKHAHADGARCTAASIRTNPTPHPWRIR